MKKSLQELELLTPVINLIDTRKIVGGYIDDGYYDQLPPGYDPSNGNFTYFDATDDHYGWYTSPAGYFSQIVCGVVK